MKKYLTSLFIFIALVIQGNEVKNNCEKIIENYFGKSVVYSFSEYQISTGLKSKIENSTGQRFFKEQIVVWEIIENDSLKALGLLDNVYGKSLPITFMVLFDLEGRVLKADIVKYREPYGGGVAERNWLNQFLGFDGNSTYKLGDDIQSISGATISCRAVTKGVKMLSLLVEEILREYEYKTVSTR